MDLLLINSFIKLFLLISRNSLIESKDNIKNNNDLSSIEPAVLDIKENINALSLSLLINIIITLIRPGVNVIKD